MSFVRQIPIGVAAGVAGAAAMHIFRLVWERQVSPASNDTIFGFDHEADVNAARLGFAFFSKQELDERTAGRIGLAMHYAFGAAVGTAYQVAWPRGKSAAAFGVLLWLCADEIPISVIAISDPVAKSVASHMSALVAHLIFGSVTGGVTRVLQTERSGSRTKRYA